MTIATGRILPDLTHSLPVRVPAPAQKRRGIDDDEMRRLFGEGFDDEQLAGHFGYCIASIRTHRYALSLHRPRGRGAGQKASQPKAHDSRHEPVSLAGKVARMPAFDHPALTERRTLYPATVAAVAGLPRLLIDGFNSWKIGAVITKGAWRGFPIYTLTLEERATCPVSCSHWRSCYGNVMHQARRVSHGPALEERLVLEIGVLASRHPAGFAVRLHVLGDFYSEAYVALWRQLIERHVNLHVFGFTARIDRDAISKALALLVVDHWPRFAMRFSNAPVEMCSTVTIEHPLQKPADAIVCPQQTGRTASCSTCALCWSSDRRIAFVRH
ncbi:MAG: hypothetical protein P4M05_28095 [Bradyrhizobium sp.]|nr:hypothetical protein [Bradyrhizobium sp.]